MDVVKKGQELKHVAVCDRCFRECDDNGSYEVYDQYVCLDCYEGFVGYWERQAELRQEMQYDKKERGR